VVAAVSCAPALISCEREEENGVVEAQRLTSGPIVLKFKLIQKSKLVQTYFTPKLTFLNSKNLNNNTGR
jgi:hypothetical protein